MVVEVVMSSKATVRFDSATAARTVFNASVLAKAQKKVQSLRCPEHGKSVIVTLDTSFGSQLMIWGCCEDVKKAAARIISQN
jgi:hypothetical protein